MPALAITTTKNNISCSGEKDSRDYNSENDSPIKQDEFYHDIISLSITCGLTPILPQNINTQYEHINPKYKSLINGYIRSEINIACDYNIFTNIPNPIYQSITLFYASFKSNESYLKHGERGNDKLLNNLSEFVEGFYSDHTPTELLCINNIHEILYASTDINSGLDPQVFRQIANGDIITDICCLFMGVLYEEPYEDLILNMTRKEFDGELAIEYLQILRLLSTYTTQNPHTKDLRSRVTGIIKSILPTDTSQIRKTPNIANVTHQYSCCMLKMSQMVLLLVSFIVIMISAI